MTGPTPPEALDDQLERTLLSWRRTALSLVAAGLLVGHLTALRTLGLRQTVRMGLAGTSSYTVRTGSFLSKRDLRLVDYKWQRQGDPLLFLNPNEAFQALDSTFAVFNRFYEGHHVHEFNGAILSKVPFLNKLQLKEVAGVGFLIAPERNLRYAELFTGIERVIKAPFNIQSKLKLGVYVIGSVANQFRNPVQLKIGITSWNSVLGRWR